MIHTEIPEAQLVVLAETGHLGHIEQPEEFATAVVKFLASGHEGAQ
jgi:proline iminopeptidase